MGQPTALRLAEYRPLVLVLRDDCPAYVSGVCKPHRCLVRQKCKTQMVVEHGIHCLDREAYNLLLFIPAMLNLAASNLPHAEIAARLSQWLFFNHARHLLTLTGWLMALKALSLATTVRDNDCKSTS